MSERAMADRVVSAVGGTATVFLLGLGGLLYFASWRQADEAEAAALAAANRAVIAGNMAAIQAMAETEGLSYGWAVVFLVAAVFTAILSAVVARACRRG